MSDRSDFYYEQSVTQAELDQAFDDMENADRNFIVDQTDTGGTYYNGIWGVFSGLAVTQRSGTPDLNVEVDDGVAYDEQGRRIVHSGGPTLVDLSTAVPGADSRYVQIYAEFSRDLSDPRTDGLGASIDYRQTESVTFSIQLGAIAASPNRPILLGNRVCIATVLLASGTTQILDSMISDELPSVGGLANYEADRQEGGVIPHGRIIEPRRKIHYSAGGGLDEVINLGGNNHINIAGGELRMATVGSDGGGEMFCETAPIYKAGPVRSAGYIQSGAGFWYSDPAGDQYGEPLLKQDKYLSYDATAMFPDNWNLQHVYDTTPTVNSWYIDRYSTADTKYQIRYRIEVTAASGERRRVTVPLTNLPFRAQLEQCKFYVYCYTAVANMEFGAAVYSRRYHEDSALVSAAPTYAAMPGTGGQSVSADLSTPHLIRPDVNAYYAVFILKTAGPFTNTDSGIHLCSCEIKYTIREASGEYYHPTL